MSPGPTFLATRRAAPRRRTGITTPRGCSPGIGPGPGGLEVPVRSAHPVGRAAIEGPRAGRVPNPRSPPSPAPTMGTHHRYRHPRPGPLSASARRVERAAALIAPSSVRAVELASGHRHPQLAHEGGDLRARRRGRVITSPARVRATAPRHVPTWPAASGGSATPSRVFPLDAFAFGPSGNGSSLHAARQRRIWSVDEAGDRPGPV